MLFFILNLYILFPADANSCVAARSLHFITLCFFSYGFIQLTLVYLKTRVHYITCNDSYYFYLRVKMFIAVQTM